MEFKNNQPITVKAKFIPQIPHITVQTIADQCSNSGGRGVLIARGILSVLTEQFQDDDILCNSGSLTSKLSSRISELDNIQVYPNPTSGILNIIQDEKISEPLHVRFLTMTGKIVKEELINDSNAQISVNVLSPGVYFIEYSNSKKSQLKKIIIK